MNREPILAEDAARAWNADPVYRTAYDALEGEFALASASIQARAAAGVTEQRSPEATNTKQAARATLASRSRRS